MTIPHHSPSFVPPRKRRQQVLWKRKKKSLGRGESGDHLGSGRERWPHLCFGDPGTLSSLQSTSSCCCSLPPQSKSYPGGIWHTVSHTALQEVQKKILHQFKSCRKPKKKKKSPYEYTLLSRTENNIKGLDRASSSLLKAAAR